MNGLKMEGQLEANGRGCCGLKRWKDRYCIMKDNELVIHTKDGKSHDLDLSAAKNIDFAFSKVTHNQAAHDRGKTEYMSCIPKRKVEGAVVRCVVTITTETKKKVQLRITYANEVDQWCNQFMKFTSNKIQLPYTKCKANKSEEMQRDEAEDREALMKQANELRRLAGFLKKSTPNEPVTASPNLEVANLEEELKEDGEEVETRKVEDHVIKPKMQPTQCDTMHSYRSSTHLPQHSQPSLVFSNSSAPSLPSQPPPPLTPKASPCQNFNTSSGLQFTSQKSVYSDTVSHLPLVSLRSPSKKASILSSDDSSCKDKFKVLFCNAPQDSQNYRHEENKSNVSEPLDAINTESDPNGGPIESIAAGTPSATDQSSYPSFVYPKLASERSSARVMRNKPKPMEETTEDKDKEEETTLEEQTILDKFELKMTSVPPIVTIAHPPLVIPSINPKIPLPPPLPPRKIAPPILPNPKTPLPPPLPPRKIAPPILPNPKTPLPPPLPPRKIAPPVLPKPKIKIVRPLPEPHTINSEHIQCTWCRKGHEECTKKPFEGYSQQRNTPYKTFQFTKPDAFVGIKTGHPEQTVPK